MNPVLWLVVGLAFAWLSCLWQSTVSRQRLFVNAIFAIVGAALGGLLATPAPQWLTADPDWAGLAGAMVGAAAVLGIGSLRSRRLRRRD